MKVSASPTSKFYTAGKNNQKQQQKIRLKRLRMFFSVTSTRCVFIYDCWKHILRIKQTHKNFTPFRACLLLLIKHGIETKYQQWKVGEQFLPLEQLIDCTIYKKYLVFFKYSDRFNTAAGNYTRNLAATLLYVGFQCWCTCVIFVCIMQTSVFALPSQILRNRTTTNVFFISL